ncbi:MAG: choice-of-anchor J domain-containing protein, partial [Bacteroidales bacterium]|nr:choice-of-anchor J domain-containing protein [Bacteroidales bacterium]
FTAGLPDGWTLANKTLPSGAENIWIFDSKYSCVKATGYVSGAAAAAEGWLISPAVTLADGKFTYKECGNYFDDAENLLKYTSVKISADGGTTWSDLTCTRNATGKAFSFVESSADVSAYVGQTVKVAFVYTSDTSMAGTWELESIVLK